MTIEILMPALSPTMTEGNLLKWHKKEGDSVAPGDMLAEIETDKATMEVEAVDEGILGKILVAEGTENVKVNSVIAVLTEEGESVDDLASYSPSSSTEPAQQKSQAEEESEPQRSESSSDDGGKATKQPQNKSSSSSNDRIIASPLAKRIASQQNIDLSNVSGTGPRGRIIKADVLGADQTAPANQHTPNTYGKSGYKDAPIGSMRKVIAKRLTESKQTVPHFYLSVDVQIDKLLSARKELNQAIDPEKITVNDFVLKACAQALIEVAEANASWMGESIRLYQNADISVAVALEEGLITPIVRAANLKSLRAISGEVKDLVQKAKNGKLKPEEFQGGSFSLSNLGMYGIDQFQAIVNPPQGCILAVGAGIQKPVVQDGTLKSATVMNCTLSVDHRVIDGKVGALLLGAIKKYLENPVLMLA
ncbi:MAG: pyruvate dehydrogenase complex dihydrolipoamide acetyltransferase [Alphaproteobacteria bacterium]|nr:MAG: pyruvate dehydrogenase complex dihydrolipoamide acetyltransferase [Alphaproteobacteria bacterium]